MEKFKEMKFNEEQTKMALIIPFIKLIQIFEIYMKLNLK